MKKQKKLLLMLALVTTLITTTVPFTSSISTNGFEEEVEVLL